MNKYELIFESLQEYLDNGEITLEEAEVLNDYAYDRYVEEATRLAKEIRKINAGVEKDPRAIYPNSDRYARMVRNAGHRTVYNADDISGPGTTDKLPTSIVGSLTTDSIHAGQRLASKIAENPEKKDKILDNWRDLKHKYPQFDHKTNQKKVFNTEPADSSYYDNKRKTGMVRDIVNDVALQRGRALIKDQADKYKKQLDSTKNPLKKAMYDIDNKKAREAIAKEYITVKKETDREANDKLKEILKNRKRGI